MNKDLFELAIAAVTGRKSEANFSVADTENALREELKKLLGTKPADFQRNKYDIFELIQTTADTILPERVMQIFGQFAEIQQIGQGNKATFKRHLGKKRAKSFITAVSPAGTYEAFRLDAETFTVPVGAVGAAALIDWERYLDGLDDMSDLVDIIMEGIEEQIYKDVYNALIKTYTSSLAPSANRVTAAGFDKAAMDRLIAVVKSYGDNAIIFCTQLFAANIANEIKTYVAEADKNDVRSQGYVGIYHGTPVVVLPMATVDEDNKDWAYNPAYAFVMPAGKEKVVKIVLEGELQINDWTNRDWSMEMQFYKKYGVAILSYNNWGIYFDQNLNSTQVVR